MTKQRLAFVPPDIGQICPAHDAVSVIEQRGERMVLGSLVAQEEWINAVPADSQEISGLLAAALATAAVVPACWWPPRTPSQAHQHRASGNDQKGTSCERAACI